MLRLVDLPNDSIEAAMAFDGVPIGIGEGLAEEGRFYLGRRRVSGWPGLENRLGAVEMVLVPLRRRPVRPSHTLGCLRFSVNEPYSLSMLPICQFFPEGHTPASLSSRRSVFRLCFTVGSGGGFRFLFSALFSVPVENEPLPARAYRGEKWEAVSFPQGKSLNFHQLTASRFFLIFGKRLQNGKRFLEALLRH